MGTENLVMLKTHVNSINICFVNDLVYGNMLWALASLRVFICNFVLYSLGLILRYIFRFQVGDWKNEHHVPSPLDETGRNQFPESEIDGFAEQLANLLFPSSEEVHVTGEETESSVSMETHCDIHEDTKKREGEEYLSVFRENDSDIEKDGKKSEGETEGPVFMETASDVLEDVKKIDENETESSVFVETVSDVLEISKNGGETETSVLTDTGSDIHDDDKESEGETEGSVFMETVSGVHEDVKKIDEKETGSSVFMEGNFIVNQDGRKREEEVQEEEEEKEGPIFTDTDSAAATSECQFASAKDISGFIEEPTTLSFKFREIYVGPNVSAVSKNAFANNGNIAENEFSELNSEILVAQEEEESAQEQRTFTSNSTCGRFRLESNASGGSDSSHDDYIIHDDNSLSSDSESESSSSSGLIWDNSNKIDDSVTYQILDSNNYCEGFESESLKVINEGRVVDVEETHFSCEREVSHGFEGEDGKEASYHGEEAYGDGLEKNEETVCEEKLHEWDSEEEEDEDDFEWEHDELVERLNLELRNARQGGLATILEEEEVDEETESPTVVEDLKPLKIEEKLEYRDHMVEIQKVYKSYAEKMRKLDVLNYQTMHAIGLLELKDSVKLILMPKSTVQGAKPLISQNLWPRKAPKHISDPMLKFVHELHRELELVYVGQVCLSWEILCWQYKKAQELKQYDSQWPRRYNLVAGEFQLFQVLMQRFIENEPFQGPRIQNYVKNRCLIRNMLQVPAIKDDYMKDKKKIKWGEEDAIGCGRLVEIVNESMRVFWGFVRADKDYGDVILQVSQQIGTDANKDPAISDLLLDIRTQLHKKERKLKDIVRRGNCIVRKFQKHHEDQIQLDHEQLLAQVGLRLISRVVNMKKLRKDQLIWCNENLNRINFVGRKILVEPSFLLFPC